MSNPYIIFVGDSRNNLQPYKSAPNKKTAIVEAKIAEETFSCVEAIYMPEDNLDINKVVYSNYRRR